MNVIDRDGYPVAFQVRATNEEAAKKAVKDELMNCNWSKAIGIDPNQEILGIREVPNADVTDDGDFYSPYPWTPTKT